MNEELKKALELIKGSIADVEVQTALTTVIPVNVLTKHVAEHEEGKKFMNSFADKRVTEGVKTALENFKAGEMATTIAKAVADAEANLTKKLKPDVTEEQKRIAELEKQQAQYIAENKKRDIELQITNHLAEVKLPTKFAPFFITDSIDKSKESIKLFAEQTEQVVKSRIDEFVKSSGYKPDGQMTGGGSSTKITKETLEKLAQAAREKGTPEARAEYSLAKMKMEQESKQQ